MWEPAIHWRQIRNPQADGGYEAIHRSDSTIPETWPFFEWKFEDVWSVLRKPSLNPNLHGSCLAFYMPCPENIPVITNLINWRFEHLFGVWCVLRGCFPHIAGSKSKTWNPGWCFGQKLKIKNAVGTLEPLRNRFNWLWTRSGHWCLFLLNCDHCSYFCALVPIYQWIGMG